MKCFSTRPHKAQSSLEFAVLCGMFMIMFVAFFFILSDRMIDFQNQKMERAAYDLMYKVQNELNMALKVHDGYNRTFWLPLQLYGQNYTINISPSETELFVVYYNRTYVQVIFVNLTSDSAVVKGKNRIQKFAGNITVYPDT